MSLENLISPSSIAVFGASNREGSVRNAVITNIILGKFTGKMFPINPSSDTVLGLKCYKNIFDIKCEIDLAVIVTPSNTVPQIIEDCGNKGVKAAIIISAGFKETGKEGKQLEEKIKEIAKRHNMRLIGPNCIGYINTNPSISLNASFAKGMPKPGNIALVSQSGAICLAMLEYFKARNVLSNDIDTKVMSITILSLFYHRV